MKKLNITYQYIGLGQRDLELIVREMGINGLKADNPNDPVWYWYLGSKYYNSMIESCFRYTCLEAEYLKHPVGSIEWKHLMIMNKQRMWEACYQSFPTLKKYTFNISEFIPLTDEQMRQHIVEKYRRKSM